MRRRPVAVVLLALLVALVVAGRGAAAEVGEFEANADVGKVEVPGAATFDKAVGTYRVSGSGENIWGAVDAFQFVYRKANGDLTLTADVQHVGAGKVPHRKAGWMVRQGLDADAPYVDVMVHGDGSIGLQYRLEKGGVTKGVKATVVAPATVKLERHGDTFTAYVAAAGTAAFQPFGTIDLKLSGDVYAGLAVCAHDAKTSETAVFSNVSLKRESPTPTPVPPAAKPDAK